MMWFVLKCHHSNSKYYSIHKISNLLALLYSLSALFVIRLKHSFAQSDSTNSDFSKHKMDFLINDFKLVE